MLDSFIYRFCGWIDDSIAKIESDKTMSNLLTHYEIEKKENTIASQKTQLAQQRLVQWLSIGFACLMLGFLFFGYRSYVVRTKTNKLLAAKILVIIFLSL